MVSKTRQLYRRIVNKHKSNDSEIDKIIADGNAVREFRKSRVAKLLEDFVEEQKDGQRDYLQVEMGSLHGFGLIKWLNSFIKYTYIVQENRGYRKIEAFLDSVERNGEKYEQQRRRESEKSQD